MKTLATLPPDTEEPRSDSQRIVHLALGQTHILEHIAAGRPLAASLDELLRFLESGAPEMACSILLLDADGKHLRHGAAPSLPKEYCGAIDGSAIGPRAGSCGTAAFLGKRVVVTDIESDPLWSDYRPLAMAYGLRACWSTPILDAEGRVLGTFAMYFKRVAQPEPIHEQLLAIALHVASIAINKELQDRAHARLTMELRERVKELSLRRRVDQELLTDRPLEPEFFDRLAALLPEGWLYPEHCRARINYGPWCGRSPGYVDSPCKLSRSFSTTRSQGLLEIAYASWPNGRELPNPSVAFLAEERQLLDTLAESIAQYFNRIHAEEALMESEERYRLINLATKDAVWDWDLRSGTLWWNDGVSLLFGYERWEVKSELHWWGERVHPQDRDRIQGRLHAAAQSTAHSWREEYRFLKKDGSYAFVQDRGYVMRDAQGMAIRMIGMMQDVTAQKRADSQIRELAYREPVTRLPNRAAFQLRVDQCIEHANLRGSSVGFILFNINCFRDVNDSLGHQNGDALLQHVAERLSGAVGSRGEVASLGGDEFAIVLPQVAPGEHVEELIERIEDALRVPFQVGAIPLQVDATLGVAVHPGHGQSCAVLWQHADVALRTAKERFQSHLVYSPEFDHYDPARLILLGELRAAIDAQELVLHYQPKVDLARGRTCGVEALVRWQHPTRGLLFPDTFVPLAERTGLINALTAQVVACAVRQGVEFMNEGLYLDVAVNLSARNLHQPGFAKSMLDLVRSAGFPISRLTFEVTETAIMADPVRAKMVLSDLRQAGVHISMDDFGVGQSSLSYLRELPISQMKIDKSFVMDFDEANNLAVVRSAIDLARNMGLEATAEGIEMESAYLALRDWGCQLGQGYFFSKPLPASALKKWLVESPYGCELQH